MTIERISKAIEKEREELTGFTTRLGGAKKTNEEAREREKSCAYDAETGKVAAQKKWRQASKALEKAAGDERRLTDAIETSQSKIAQLERDLKGAQVVDLDRRIAEAAQRGKALALELIELNKKFVDKATKLMRAPTVEIEELMVQRDILTGVDRDPSDSFRHKVRRTVAWGHLTSIRHVLPDGVDLPVSAMRYLDNTPFEELVLGLFARFTGEKYEQSYKLPGDTRGEKVVPMPRKTKEEKPKAEKPKTTSRRRDVSSDDPAAGMEAKKVTEKNPTHRVLKPIPAGDYSIAAGSLVDASGWRPNNREGMERSGTIERLEAEEATA